MLCIPINYMYKLLLILFQRFQQTFSMIYCIFLAFLNQLIIPGNPRCIYTGKTFQLLIIADTKFEFGLDEQGRVVIGDEMLTPDSSRFWPREGYEAGKGQPSYDKQFVRDWLKQNPDSDYNLPEEVIDKTVAKYKEAYEQLTGEEFNY